MSWCVDNVYRHARLEAVVLLRFPPRSAADWQSYATHYYVGKVGIGICVCVHSLAPGEVIDE